MKSALSIVVIVIGAYMIFSFNDGGWMSPPVLSGLAFVLLGVMTCPHLSKKLGK